MGIAAAAAAQDKTNKNHIVIFPFLAKGHTIPLLHLSTALAARGRKVTFLTTPANYPFYHQYLHLPNPRIRLVHLPFPAVPSIPDGVESTDHLPSFDLYPTFLFATKLLDQPFRAALLDMSLAGDLPLCVISDFFSGWTLPICQEFGVPRLVFHGMGVFAMVLCKSLSVHQTHQSFASGKDDDDFFHVPGTPGAVRLKYSDVPTMIRNFEADPTGSFVMESAVAEVESWGVVVNSFAEMEDAYVPLFEGFYKNGAKAWLMGPLCLYPCSDPEDSSESDPCLRFLDGRDPGSVVYVSFGTQATLEYKLLDEIWHGLRMSGHDFLWVVRSTTWSPPSPPLAGAAVEEEEKGFVYRGWALQKLVLHHESTGGFVSHCGWNSVLESISAGVPILAWPMLAEQPLNAKYVADGVGVALRVEGQTVGGGVVGRAEVCKGVRELMGGKKGRKVRERAAELGKVARGAVEGGGSSHRAMDKILEELREVKIK